MGKITLLQLTAACLISFIVPSATALSRAVDTIALLPRAANSCSTSGYLPCTQAGLPSSFCCPSGSQCVVFNNAASVVCCPSGDCNTIAPILCDITFQNATLHPEAELHSIDLQEPLETCGSACCPKGFSCQNKQCIMKASTSSSASTSTTSKPSTSSSQTTFSTTSKLPSSTLSSSLSSSSKSSTQTFTIAKSTPTQAAVKNGTVVAQCDRFPAIAILAGFFPGLLLGILLTIIAIICIGRRQRSTNKRESSDFGSVAATVSDPIYQPQNNAFRTDFLRHESRSKQQGQQQKRSSIAAVKSLFSRSPTIKNADGVGRSVKTPVRTPEMRKEPSMESIKIYSPPSEVFRRPPTTFTDMMAHAGFKPGEPYLGSPARIHPKATGGGRL